MTRKPPPADTRFKAGQSGNPRGRPKKVLPSAPASPMDALGRIQLNVQIGDRVEELSADEALQFKTYTLALKGSQRARRLVLDMIKKRELALRKHNPPVLPAVRLEHETSNPTNAFDALLLLGICTPSSRPDHAHSNDKTTRSLVLEPWSVQAALDRPVSLDLDDGDIQLVRNFTRDSQTLVWPQRHSKS